MKKKHIHYLLICFLAVQVIWGSSIVRGHTRGACLLAVVSPMDRVFHLLESVKNKSSLEMARSHRSLYNILMNWKKGHQNIKIETFLRIAYFLGTRPSTLLKFGAGFTASVQVNERDIQEAVRSRQPLSIDMLRYMESKNPLSAEYEHDLERRSFLSDEQIRPLLDHIYAQLRNRILELRHTLSLSLGRQPSLLYLSQRIGVKQYDIKRILSYHQLPPLNVLGQILKGIGTDSIAFFEDVESSDKFQFPSQSPSAGQRLNSRQGQRIRFIGSRIQQAMDSRDMGGHKDVANTTGLNKKRLNNAESDIYLQSLVYTSLASEVPLSVLVSPKSSLEDYTTEHLHSRRSKNEIRAEKLSGDYLLKFKKAFINFIKFKMNEQNLSFSQLSQNSYLTLSHIKNILLHGHLPHYLILLKIVLHGFGQSLESFFQEFERYVEISQNHQIDTSNPYWRFEQAIRAYDPDHVVELREDLSNYSSSYRGIFLEEALIFFHDRVLKATDSAKLSLSTVRQRTGVYIDTWNTDSSKLRITGIIRLAHFFGITPFQLLGFQSSLEQIDPANFTDERLSEYKPPTNEEIERAMDRLRDNIQRQKDHAFISDQDLQIRLTIDELKKLDPILYGENTATLFRLLQVAEALIWIRVPAPDDLTQFIYIPPASIDAFYGMLEVLLEGVGIPR